MPSANAFTVTVPDDLAEMIREKVSAGEYASESEIVSEGLAALKEREIAVEGWLRTRVAAAYDRAASDPGSLLTSAELRARLRASADRIADDT